MADSSNVRVAVTGGVYRPDVGTTLPTDATTPLAGGITANELGYVSTDGVVESTDTQEANVVAWQGGDVVRVIQTEHSYTLAFTCIESTDAVREAYYGNVAAGKVEVNGAPGVRGPWVFEILDEDHVIRIVVPDGQVTSRGQVTYASTEAVAYPLTITCYPDPDYSGNEDYPAKAYIYFDGGSS